MVFRVTEDGIIKADTLCKFTESPLGTKRLVGDQHKVRRVFAFYSLLKNSKIDTYNIVFIKTCFFSMINCATGRNCWMAFFEISQTINKKKKDLNYHNTW